MKYLSPPGSPVDPSLIKQAIHSSPSEFRSVRTKVITVASYSGALYLLNRIRSFISSCNSQNDFKTNPDEITTYKARLSELRSQLHYSYEDFSVSQDFAERINKASLYLTGKATNLFMKQVISNANRVSENVIYNTSGTGK